MKFVNGQWDEKRKNSSSTQKFQREFDDLLDVRMSNGSWELFANSTKKKERRKDKSTSKCQKGDEKIRFKTFLLCRFLMCLAKRVVTWNILRTE